MKFSEFQNFIKRVKFFSLNYLVLFARLHFQLLYDLIYNTFCLKMVNFNFKLLSLNARGIRDFHKRKTFFTWIKKQKVDIAFLQETYSSPRD